MSKTLINKSYDDDETVLLMATNPRYLNDYRQLLATHYSCLSVTSFAESLQILQKEPVKALLLTEQHPDENSIEFIRAAHRIKPETQKVLVAERVDTKILLTVLNEGSLFRCLLLPITPVVLVRAVKDALRRHEMERVQRDLAVHAAEIDLYLHSVPYWLHRLKRTVALGTQSILVGTGLILGSGLLILLLGVTILLVLYFLKSILGIDFFEDRHLRDFLPAVRG